MLNVRNRICAGSGHFHMDVELSPAPVAPNRPSVHQKKGPNRSICNSYYIGATIKPFQRDLLIALSLHQVLTVLVYEVKIKGNDVWKIVKLMVRILMSQVVNGN